MSKATEIRNITNGWIDFSKKKPEAGELCLCIYRYKGYKDGVDEPVWKTDIGVGGVDYFYANDRQVCIWSGEVSQGIKAHVIWWRSIPDVPEGVKLGWEDEP